MPDAARLPFAGTLAMMKNCILSEKPDLPA